MAIRSRCGRVCARRGQNVARFSSQLVELDAEVPAVHGAPNQRSNAKMDPLIGSALISAGGSLLGGIMGNNTEKKQMRMQREFAQNAIQWKVKDAEAAGIHPLYALGANTVSYSPIQTGSLGQGIQQAGQDIGRAVEAHGNRADRLDGFTKASQALILEKGQLENELLKTQIASNTATLNQPGTPPPMQANANRYLIPGQGSTQGLVRDNPMSRTVSSPQAPSQEPGAVPETGFGRSKTGYPVMPSKDAKERIEDQFLPQTSWAIRNNLMPMLYNSEMNPPFKAPYGKKWVFNWIKQEYQLHDKDPGVVRFKLKPWDKVERR